MGIFTMFKANKAYRAQKNDQKDEAMRLYEECFAEGLNDARYVLPYAVLMIRDGQYQKAKDFLVKHQKAPGMTPDQRVNLIVDYAACCFRLGDLDKAIGKLEELHRKAPKSLIYQTLGYLYVEKYDLQNKPDFGAMQAAPAEEPADEAAGSTVTGAEGVAENAAAEEGEGATEKTEQKKTPTPEEAWEEGIRKALAFNEEAVEYDDEDSICLDNMGQFQYRVLGDKEAAKPWFDKAHGIKPGQIDTLYFLSRYDLDRGDRAAAAEKLEKASEGRFSPLNYCGKDMILAELAALKGDK